MVNVQSISRRQFAERISLGTGALMLGARPALSKTEVVDFAKVVLGVPAGTGIDQVARLLADGIKPGYAANTMVENRTGASGILAVAYTKQAPTDGRTVLVAASSPIAIYPSTYKQLPYRWDQDLIPVSTAVVFDIVLAVGPMVPANVTTLESFFAWCKANPNQASFGSPAAGSAPHFIGSMTARSVHTDITHVPYRGPSGAVTDMLGGRLAAVVVPLSDLLQFQNDSRCRMLAITGTKRSRYAPQVKTFDEQGLGQHATREWIGVFLPAGTSNALVQQLGDSVKQTVLQPKFTAAMEQGGKDVQWSTSDELRHRIRSEAVYWREVAKTLNFTAEM